MSVNTIPHGNFKFPYFLFPQFWTPEMLSSMILQYMHFENIVNYLLYAWLSLKDVCTVPLLLLFYIIHYPSHI